MQLVPDILFNWRSGLGDELVMGSVSVITQKRKITRTDLQSRWNVKDSPLEDEVKWIYYMWLLVPAYLLHQLNYVFLTSSNVFMASKQ